MRLSFFLVVVALVGNSAMAQEILPVCDRTEGVKNFIVQQINSDQGGDKTCEEITEEDLASLTRVAPRNANIINFKAGDFTGLVNLEILNIRSNPYETLPEGLFRDLGKLKTLVIIATGLRYYPDDFLKDTPQLENCHCFANGVRSISESIFQRLGQLEHLKVLDFDRSLQDPDRARLEAIFPLESGVQLNFF